MRSTYSIRSSPSDFRAQVKTRRGFIGQPAFIAATLCSGLSFWCLPATAQWLWLTTDAQAQYFIAQDQQREGERISVWRLSNFVKPLTNLEGKEVLSETTRATLDCQTGKLANSEVTRFDGLNGQGEVMNHYETPLRFTRIAPDTVDAVLLQKLCVK
jgi:hypothetical protein